MILHCDGYYEALKVKDNITNPTIEYLYEGSGPISNGGFPAQCIVGHLIYYFNDKKVYSYNTKSNVWSTHAALTIASNVNFQTPVYYQNKSFLIYKKPTDTGNLLTLQETYPDPNYKS